MLGLGAKGMLGSAIKSKESIRAGNTIEICAMTSFLDRILLIAWNKATQVRARKLDIIIRIQQASWNPRI